MKTSFIFLVAFAVVADESLCAQVPNLSAKPPKGKVSLLNSYLPAAMQVLAHLTNQMKFERDPSATTAKPASTTTKATSTASISNSEVTSAKPELTTQSHKPGVFAPIPPLKPEKELKSPEVEEEIVPPIIENPKPDTLLNPYNHDVPVIHPHVPQESAPYVKLTDTENFPVVHPESPYRHPSEAFLPPSSYHQDPLYSQFSQIARSGDDGEIAEKESEKYPDISSLPVENENNFKYNPLEIEPEELSEENLQYLSGDVREILRRQRDFKVEKWTDATAFQTIEELFDDLSDKKNVGDFLRLKKASPSQSFIQMLLLYDLLNRDAKKQKLNNYNGYNDYLLKDLAATSKGTAIDQLKVILERMIARGDCTYDFANNRAKEMIKELEKPESSMSNEIRYLKPLRYVE